MNCLWIVSFGLYRHLLSWCRHSEVSDDVVFRAGAAVFMLETHPFEHLAHFLERGIVFPDAAVAKVHHVDDPR